MKPKLLLIVLFIKIDLLQKDPSKRMVIKEVLEHPWMQKHVNSNLMEIRRQSRDVTGSNFKLYSMAEETSDLKK
jgi:hypothetical protein